MFFFMSISIEKNWAMLLGGALIQIRERLGPKWRTLRNTNIDLVGDYSRLTMTFSE